VNSNENVKHVYFEQNLFNISEIPLTPPSI